MPRNVEIKARVEDAADTRRRAAALADGIAEVLVQEDVFLEAPRGRWKLRTFDDGTGELIAYRRPDRDEPAVSEYRIDPVPDSARMRAVLELACGVRAVVRKRRELFRAGRTRIHLDRVDALGDFLELEVVLRADESEADGTAEARFLMERLGVEPAALVAAAYVDLLEEDAR
ncbi:MAG TPA: class IV adenylate cyclase [bacterium]|nr:class IV adenylate cyclase [bacterium]